MTAPSPADILARVEQEKIKFILLQFTDLMGTIKSVTIPAMHLAEAFDHGAWFDGSSIEGFARVAESDMYLIPDPVTFASLPWLSGDEATARLICNVCTPTGQLFAGDARYVLVRALAEADKMGFVYNTGPELEFFLFKIHAVGGLTPQVPQGETGYFDSPTDQAAGLWRGMVSTLYAFGIVVEACTPRSPTASTRSTLITPTGSPRPITPSPSASCSRFWPSRPTCTPRLCPTPARH
jgi:glutamine synthetase